jgi:hypothetical protein
MVSLQTATVFWLGRGTISLRYWLYVGLMMLGRQKCIQQNYKCLNRVPLRLRGLLKSWQDTDHQVLIKSQQNWFKQGVDQLAVRSLHLFILSGIRRNYLRSGRSWSLCLSIRRGIKKTVVIIEAYHFCQLCTEFYPTSCCLV